MAHVEEAPAENSMLAPEPRFEAFLAEGRLVLQRCRREGRFFFYPRVLCPHCGSSDLEWEPVSGAGTVYSVTTVRRRAEQGGDYAIALVDLAEGPRLMGLLEGETGAIGSHVAASVRVGGEQPLVVFRLEP